MNAAEILRIVDAIHRDKNIPQEIVFEGIEAALVSALAKYYGEEAAITCVIDRKTGVVAATCDGEQLDSEEVVGRIGAQTAKQVMIQKIREAERDALYDEYTDLVGQMVSGVVHRNEGAAATIVLHNVEALLPRSEQIPGETHHVNERVRCTVYEARKAGSRVKVILSRKMPALVQRLFEQEIPEIADGVIEIRAMAREPGYRSKVAVISSDARIDCVGACVGVRGNRIKNIVDELSGERIDIVRWDDDLEVLIPNALQPAEVDQVILCRMLGRAIALVQEDNLSLAIGRRGQNVRLASKLSGWDIEIMTQEELAENIDRAIDGFSAIEGLEMHVAEKLVEEGFLSYDDLSIIEPDDLMTMGELTEEQAEKIVEQAETLAEEAEAAAAAARRAKRDQDRRDAELAELQASAGISVAAEAELAAQGAAHADADLDAESVDSEDGDAEHDDAQSAEDALSDTPADELDAIELPEPEHDAIASAILDGATLDVAADEPASESGPREGA